MLFFKVAAASALANWSLLLLRKSEKVAELGPREDVLRAIISKLETVDSFGDKDEVAMIRLLQAIVTLMWGDKQVIQVILRSTKFIPISIFRPRRSGTLCP